MASGYEEIYQQIQQLTPPSDSTTKPSHGGYRPGAGRKRRKTDDKIVIKISKRTKEQLETIKQQHSLGSIDETVCYICDLHNEVEQFIINSVPHMEVEQRFIEDLAKNILEKDYSFIARHFGFEYSPAIPESKKQPAYIKINKSPLVLGTDMQLSFPVRKHPDRPKSDTTPEYRKFAAQLMKYCKIQPGSMQSAIEGLFRSLNIHPMGKLPSKNTHTRIMIEYALLGDLCYLYKHRKNPTYIVTDDLTRLKLGRQVAVLGTKDSVHLINLSALVSGKTAENKAQVLIDYENLIADLVRELDIEEFTEQDARFLSFIVAKINDRFGAELSMTKILQKLQQERGAQPMIQLNCNSHLANTCTDASSTVRNNEGTRWKDSGFLLKRKMIELYYSNIRLLALLHKETGCIYHFRKSEQESRCFKALYFAKDYYDLVLLYRKFVQQEVIWAKSKRQTVPIDVLEIKTQLHDPEALGGLFVNMVEDIKLLQPFMNMLRVVKGGVQFGEKIAMVISQMDTMFNNQNSIHKFAFENSNLFPKEYLSHQQTSEPYEEIDQLFVVRQLQLILLAWREKMKDVYTQIYGPGTTIANLNSTQKQALDFVPNNSNIGESFVGAASYSIKQAGMANTTYHCARVQLIRNEFPDDSFLELLGENGQTVRKYVEIIRSMSDKQNKLEASYKELYGCLAEIEKFHSEQIQSVSEASDNEESEAESNELCGMDDALENSQTFESLDMDELLALSNNKLKERLRAANLPIGRSKKRFMAFKLANYYRNIQYNSNQKAKMRNTIVQMTSEFFNQFNNIKNAVQSNSCLQVLQYRPIRLQMCDTEWCFRSAIIKNTTIRRPGGKQLYAIAQLEPFSRWSCYSYARRFYIEPVKDKITITADDRRIRTAPEPEEVMNTIICFEKLLNAGSIIEMHWATNNCDITTKNDALAEGNLSPNTNIIHANALTLVKYLLPGQSSYALPNLTPSLGFPDYDAHDPLEDCIAAIRCLLYAIHCYLGPDARLSEDQVNSLILNLISEYELELVVTSNNKKQKRQD